MGVSFSRLESRLWLSALIVSLACVPKNDLSDYAGASGAGAGGSGAAGGSSGSGGSASTSPEAGVSGSAGASGAGNGGDAGSGVVPPDASPPADAATDAAGDARSALIQRCEDLDGVLEPGTNTCFLISGPPLAPLDWPSAADACETWGGSLVVIKSQQRDEFLTVAVPRPFWIGARDPLAVDPTSRNFRWVDDNSLVDDGYNNWGPLEPDNTIDQFCVEKRDDLATDPWFDQPCSELKAYVCEQEL